MAPRWAWKVAFGALFLTSAYFLLTPRPPSAGLSGESLTLGHKVGHAAMFASLGFALARASRRPRLQLWAGLVLWGALTELLQTRIPGRSGELGDVLLDAASAVTAFAPRVP